MFSSNQKLEISGDYPQLKHALEFAIKYYEPQKVTFQKTKNGKFCLGWYTNEHWTDFQFNFDIDIVSKIIIQFLEEQKHKQRKYDNSDGSTSEGFLMKVIQSTFADEENGIKEPFYGIVSFEKFTNFYAK